MKSRFGAALEPFTIVRLDFYEKENRELVTISRAEILKSNFDLAAQLEVAEVLGYMAELIGEFAPPHEANDKLFRMVKACVEALAATPDAAKVILRYFEIWLLRLAGSFPDVGACGVCGRVVTSGQPVFLDAESGVRCQECSRGSGTRLIPAVLQSMVASQRLGPTDFARSCQGNFSEIDKALGALTHRLIVRVLDRRPRSMVAPAQG